MLQFHCYPEGKKRVVTFSYDDGSENDARLTELFNRYGVKGTFHLNGGRRGRAEIQKLRERYRGHEIACHTVSHGWLDKMPTVSVIRETMENRAALEEIAQQPVVGMSYPSGGFSPVAVEALRACGVVYSRTTRDTMHTDLPQDFLRWDPTCHHRSALKLAEGFMQNLDSQWCPPLMYVWGHSHEFRTEEDWAYMERTVALLAGSDRIWYATNMEIYTYLQAVRALRVSAEETWIANPSATDVWVERDKREIIRIPAGATVELR